MRHGDEIKCPKCGKEAFAIKKVRLENWTNAGEYLACSACDEELQASSDKATSKQDQSEKKLSALASLLNTEPEKKIQLSVEEDETHFCRDCKYYVKHPFLSRCELHKKEVTPMADCEDFTRALGEKQPLYF